MSENTFLPLTIVARKHEERVRHALLQVIAYLRAHDIPFVLDSVCQTMFNIPNVTTVNLHHVKHGLLVSVGGDGSLLRILSHACANDLPVLGIHSGNVGFLSDITLDSLQSLVTIIQGTYAFESRSLLGASYKSDGSSHTSGPALNEFVISSAVPGKLIRYQLLLRGKVIAHHHADGIIVATPTGSTAYALSAGGPVMTPSLASNLILPVCPHTLSSRPIVLPESENVEIRLDNIEGHDAVISFDGHDAHTLDRNSVITVHTHSKKLRLIHPQDYDFFVTLQNKLHWEMPHHDPGYND